MKLIETAQIQNSSLQSIIFDCFICSSGFEKRANFVAKSFKINSKSKFVIAFNNYSNEPSRQVNDKFYKDSNFEFICQDGDQSGFFSFIWDRIFDIDREEINIAVDYTSMTRVWYSSIISFLKNLESTKRINVYFLYSYSKFARPFNSYIRNIHIGPIKGFSSLSIPDKPTALIIGLGYENERAFGLTEYLDAETYIFTADKSKGEEYYSEVQSANEILLNYTKPENIFEYSLMQLENSESLLYSVCRSLITDYRLILAPTGPKPFTLLCLLTSLRLGNIDVWRISAGENSKPINKEPDGIISCYRATFCDLIRTI